MVLEINRWCVGACLSLENAAIANVSVFLRGSGAVDGVEMVKKGGRYD